jgi:hypothetical protein
MPHALVPQPGRAWRRQATPNCLNHPLKMGGRFSVVIDNERQALPDPAHRVPDVTRKAI